MILGAAILLAALSAGGQLVLEAPPFQVVAPPALRPYAESVARDAGAVSARVAAELGVPPLDAGTIVLLGPASEGIEGEPPAPAPMPPWAAGIALPSSRTIFIRVDRLGPYGRRRLTSVAVHEITHLTMAAALPLSGREAPAWFREGTASWLAGEEEWRDLWVVWTSPLVEGRPFGRLDEAFARGQEGADLAYAGSLAAVAWLRRAFGEEAPSRVLAGLRRGERFEEAFIGATGVTLAGAERLWAEDLDQPPAWLLRAASSAALWAALTGLVLLAFWIKRRRSRLVMDRWREEEEPRAAQARRDSWGGDDGFGGTGGIVH